MIISVFEGLHDLPDEWHTKAATTGFYLRPDFLGYVASVSPDRCLRFEEWSDQGLRAALPGWLWSGGGHPYLDPVNLFEDLGVRPGSHLLLGSPRAFAGQILGAERISDCKLGPGVARWATDQGTASAIGLYLDAASSVALSNDPSHTALHDFDTAVDVPTSFDQYLTALPKGRRQTVRTERSTFSRFADSITAESASAVADEFAPLVVEHEARYGRTLNTSTVAANLVAQSEAMPGAVLVLAARDRTGAMVAGSVLYVDSHAVHVRMVGLTEEARRAFGYFNVMFYGPLEIAIARRLRRLQLGVTALQAKVLRGAHLEPRFAVRLDCPWPRAAARSRGARHLAEAAELSGSFPWALPPAVREQISEIADV
ncbi:peptidogalycan biosysnthesis protein [Microlunatus soli]|uniref:Predicted N-acyltransferase n=1 Tax=Microlunatus soli TaxID=630515 RepID=A0A1H1SAA6_9ACTN|nr:GNAT family N-acetyltransferase [Microlunatus soli]SDS44696.1 Predicted N-acyltransferase [Microlunatus soli]